MSGVPQLPPALRRVFAEDSRPVRPLASPFLRALVLLVWAPLAVTAVLAIPGSRPDAASLGWLLSWGVVLVELAAGAGLVTLALAETVPGRGAGRGVGLLALAGAAAAFVALAVLTRRASPGVMVEDPFLSLGPTCLGLQELVGLTALAVVAVLVLRAVPLRAAFAGLLAGAGAGLMAEGVYHLHCPITHLGHVLVWHGAAVALLGLLGLVFGFVVERRERKGMERRLG